MAKAVSPFTILRSVFTTLASTQEIWYPIVIRILINFAILEVLFFAHRFPLSGFFSPIIRKVWGEQFLHYPLNLALLPKLFYYAQMVVLLFVGSYLLAVTAHMVAGINSEQKVRFKNSFRKCAPMYVHIFCVSLLSLLLFQAFNSIYDLAMQRAWQIRSTTGMYFLIKKAVILGAPYVQFVASILLTVFLTYLVPIIVIEQKKILPALVENVKVLSGSFWLTLIVVLIPTVFYLPVFILRNNIAWLVNKTFPEIQLLVIAFATVATVLIGSVVLIATTTLYLYKKEKV